MGSTRLPGKVLLPLGDSDVLSWVLFRVLQADLVGEVYVATSTLASDDPIVARTTAIPSVKVLRGSEEDVLGRYALALDNSAAHYFVRITADCPLIDPAIIDEVIRLATNENSPCDYASNTLERSFPRGLDVEVFSRTALAEASREATEGPDREHVTPFIWRQPDRYHLRSLVHSDDLSFHRWTLDTKDDYSLLQGLCTALGIGGMKANMPTILSALAQNPELVELNRGVKQKDS